MISIFHLDASLLSSTQVSSIYADASIGNSIKIAVVHIMYIERDLVSDTLSANGKFSGSSSFLMLQHVFSTTTTTEKKLNIP